MEQESPVAAQIRQLVETYAQKSLDQPVRAVCDPHRQTCILMTAPGANSAQPAQIVALIRVLVDYVFIDQDDTPNHALTEWLLQNDVPADTVVRVYEGESLDNFSEMLGEILRREVAQYAGHSYTADTYKVHDVNRHIYMVVRVPHNRVDDAHPDILIMARISGGKIVIEEDTMPDKPLYQSLIVNAGIPRDGIILAYDGESLPALTDDDPTDKRW